MPRLLFKARRSPDSIGLTGAQVLDIVKTHAVAVTADLRIAVTYFASLPFDPVTASASASLDYAP